jgi:choline dehydrogenase-like flavoprotein
MQFYVDGYKPGDPLIAEAHPSVAERMRGSPAEVDVLVIGCGPAGLALAAELANFPDIRTVIIDRRDGPLEVGQADGVACRTVEMFEAFGPPLRSVRSRRGGQHRERIGVSGDSDARAHEGTRGDGRDIDHPGQVRRGLRRLAQQHPCGDWAPAVCQRLCDKFDDVPADEMPIRLPRVCSSPVTPVTRTAPRPGRG